MCLEVVAVDFDDKIIADAPNFVGGLELEKSLVAVWKYFEGDGHSFEDFSFAADGANEERYSLWVDGVGRYVNTLTT